MHSPCKLINHALNKNISIFLRNGQLRVCLPWPWEAIPKREKPFLRELKQQQDELKHFLLQVKSLPYEAVPGKTLYPARQSCIQAGYCLQLAREPDCWLFPFLPGWCRERVSMKAGELRNAS